MLVKRLLRPLYAPPVRYWRRRRQLFSERRRIRDAVRLKLQSGHAVKIIIGAGQTSLEGWIATDVPAFDIRKRDHWQSLFPPAAIDRMLAEHVFEHLTREELSKFMDTAREFLAPGGRVRIAVPDGCHPDADYIRSVEPGGTGVGASDHKTLYTFDLIGELLQEQGYRHELLEYFDEDGQFHQRDWSKDDGFVGRSADHDERNADGRLSYTSLIVDCWPQ